MTLDVILNILEQEEESIDTDIGIEPLIEEPEAESDRDSDESDDEVTGNFDNLLGEYYYQMYFFMKEKFLSSF